MGRDEVRRGGADRLAGAAFAILAATPAASIFSRGIAATLLVVVAALLLVAGFAARIEREALRDLRVAATSPGGLCLAALALLALASAAWSLDSARGAWHALQFGGSVALAGLAGALAARFSGPGSALKYGLTAGVALASAVMLYEFRTEGAIREALGLQIAFFRLNRAAVAVVLFLPLACALLLRGRALVATLVLMAVAVTAALMSESNSAKLGVLVALLVSPFALLAPRAAHRVVGVGVVGTMLAMPLVAPVVNDLLPGWVHARPGFASMIVRGEVWREITPLLAPRPFFGWGLEATQAFARIPGIEDVGPERFFLLAQGHPHNAPLQIWLELGLVGALLAAAALGFGFRALERLPAHLLPAATTTAAIAFAIACVSHGAWQAWWWGLLGLVAIAFAAAASQPRGEA